MLPPAYREFFQLWSACRSGMGGVACWPDAGGVSQQAAWIVDAFAILASADADEMERKRRGHVL
jgi:hypothetical protein